MENYIYPKEFTFVTWKDQHKNIFLLISRSLFLQFNAYNNLKSLRMFNIIAYLSFEARQHYNFFIQTKSNSLKIKNMSRLSNYFLMLHNQSVLSQITQFSNRVELKEQYFLKNQLIQNLKMEFPQSKTNQSYAELSNSVLTTDRFRKSFGGVLKYKHRKPSLKSANDDQITIDKKEPVEKNDLYFQVRVISKIGVFIEKLKSFVTLSQPNFKYNEMEYIQNQSQQEGNDNWLFSPSNKVIIAFQIIVFLVSIVSIWNASFCVVFTDGTMTPLIFRMIAIGIFSLEIFVNFNLKVPTDFSQQKMIEDRASIIKNNLKNKLPYDLISLISLALCEIFPENSWAIIIMRMLVVIKIKSIFSFIQTFRLMFVATAQEQTKANIVVLLMQIFLFVHFLSLFLNLMVIVENHYGIYNTWVSHYKIQNCQNWQLYLYGWYWGANLLTTVGLGDIIPANVYEAFIISFVEIFCTAFFGFLMSYIGGMLKVLGQATQVFEKDMRKLNTYLQKVNISHDLKNQVRKQLSYARQITKIQDPEVQERILAQLPVHMKNQMKVGNNTNILMNSHFFKKFSHQILTELAMRLNRIIYSPQQNIFFKGQSETKLWIVQKGSIKQVYNNAHHNSEKILAEYSPQNSHPGYINFMTDQHFTTFGKSEGFTWTYQLKRTAMIQLLKNYPVQYFKFCQTKDRMILKGKKYISSCYACGKLSHNTIQCPKTHFKPQLQVYKLPRVIKKQKCVRQQYQRSMQRHNSRIVYSIIVQELMVEKPSNGNIISSNKIGSSSNYGIRKIGRVSITEDYRNVHSSLQHSVSRKQENTIQEELSYQIIEQKKDPLVMQTGQWRLNQHYFPESSVKSVLKQYNNSKIKKAKL